MDKSPYTYATWINDALLDVIKKTIKVVERQGLYGDIHFYITFATNHPLAKIPNRLKVKYPKLITLVLQNQFYALKTDSRGFAVTLLFNGVAEDLYIPWSSIIQLVDPSSHISLRLEPISKSMASAKDVAEQSASVNNPESIPKNPDTKASSTTNTSGANASSSKGSNNKIYSDPNIIKFPSPKK